MILKCLKCHRPYDVSKYNPGQKLRCGCGQIMVVPKDAPSAHSVVMLHCANCGGALEKGQADCSFCGAAVDFSSARLTAYCTECCTTSKEGAQFCSGCGAPLTARMDAPEDADELCPRCRVPMRRRAFGAHKPLECPMCLGIFVEIDAFDVLIRKQEQRIGKVSTERGEPRQSLVRETKITYINCPVCAAMMNRQNYGRISGVIVDYCPQHGYWLDEGELEKIAAWVATGGLDKKRQVDMREQQAAERHRREMAASAAEPHDMGIGASLGSARFGGDSRGAVGLFDLVTRLFD